MSLKKTLLRANWGQIMVINSAIIMFTIAVVTQQIIMTPTQIGSKATIPTPSPPPSYPTTPPSISAIQPIFAKPGDAVSISGNFFGEHQWQSSISLDGQNITPDSITLWSDHRINITLPRALQTDRLSTLILNVDQSSTASPIAIYQPGLSTRLGLNHDRTQLFIEDPPEDGYLLVGFEANTILKPLNPNTIRHQPNTIIKIPLNTSSNILLTSSQPLHITHLIPTINTESVSIELPYYIHPQNPLFVQSPSINSSLD